MWVGMELSIWGLLQFLLSAPNESEVKFLGFCYIVSRLFPDLLLDRTDVPRPRNVIINTRARDGSWSYHGLGLTGLSAPC